MGENNIVVTDATAIPISASAASKIRVVNGHGQTLYFKKEVTVSATSNDGSLAAGEAKVFSTPQWFISTSVGCRMFVEHIPDATTDMATQAELEEAESTRKSADETLTTNVAVIKQAPINIEYPEYGAVGATDGTAVDCTEALEKAIATLPECGGEILIPRRYKVSKKLNFDEKRSVHLRGLIGLGGGLAPASQLVFTQTGSEALVSARSTAGFQVSDLEIEYTSGSFTGPCIDLSHGTKGGDSAYFALDNMQIIGSGVHTALGLDLDKAIIGTLRDVKLTNLDIGARGAKEAGSYSNAITIEGGAASGIVTAALKNAGVVWNVKGMQFNPLTSGKAGAYIGEEGVATRGTTFEGIYCGDATVAGGTWITWYGDGLAILGGMIGSGDLGLSVPGATSNGVSVLGVNFWSMKRGIQANFGAGTQHYVIGGNSYTGVSGKKVSLDNGATDAGEGFLAS